jgi:hypothetical protein
MCLHGLHSKRLSWNSTERRNSPSHAHLSARLTMAVQGPHRSALVSRNTGRTQMTNSESRAANERTAHVFRIKAESQGAAPAYDMHTHMHMLMDVTFLDRRATTSIGSVPAARRSISQES